MNRFLHLKFASGRPPPIAASIPWAHEVDPARDPLHDTLKSDVQREGVVRYLQQNFPAGSYVHDVVHEREADAGMFILCTKNWARSVGDPKLHLSLYVYQEDSHCATWHAYTDRSISYSREGNETDPPPNGSDPYSTPDALAAAASRAASPMPPVQDDDRPRFDRPAAAPDSDTERAEEPFQPDELLSPSGSAASARQPTTASRAKRSPRPDASKAAGDLDNEPEQPRKSRSTTAENQPPADPTGTSQRASRSARRREPSSDGNGESEEEKVDLSKPAYPILKSKPIAQRSSRSVQRSPSPSPSPSPPPRRPHSRSARKERSPSPEQPKRESRAKSASPSRSPSPPSAAAHASGRAERLQDHERQRSRRRAPRDEERTSRSSSPPPRSSRKARALSPSSSAERTRSASPPPRDARRSVAQVLEDEVEHVKEKVVRQESHRGRSPSRSPSPPPQSRASRSDRSAGQRADNSKKVAPPRGRSASRSPSPPRHAARRSRSSPPRGGHPSEGEVTERVRAEGRGRSSVRPAPPAAVVPAPSAPGLERTPSWRSVSRNRHRRDDSDDDTLVRGNMDDHELDIPAGGEVSLLEAKRRSASKDRSARRPRVHDEGFDPAVVAKPPPAPPKQTAKEVFGGWIMSVGTLLKTEEELAVGTIKEKILEVEVETDEARLKRKAERAKRREARAARRAAREEAEEQLYAAEASQARGEREALLQAEADRKKTEREGKARIVAEEEARSARRDEPPRAKANRPRASSRRRAPSLSASDDEQDRPAPPRSSRRDKPDEPDRSRVRASRHRHHGSSNVESPSELDNDVEPIRPPAKQRAMSISATVESGLRGLRDSVAKIVSNATEVEHAVVDKARRSSARSAREKDKGRSAHSDSESEVEHQRAREQRKPPRRTTVVETDGESHRGSRRPKPSAPPAAPSSRGHRDEDDVRPQHSSRAVQAPSASPDDAELSDATPLRSSRQARRPPVEPSESDASSVPPPTRRRTQVSSDTEASDAPSRPSSRLTVRSESEGDLPVHRLAKLNAALNATAEPVDLARQSRDDQFAQIRRPTSTRPEPARDRSPLPPPHHEEKASRRKGRHLFDEIRDEADEFEHKVGKLSQQKLSRGGHDDHYRQRALSMSSEDDYRTTRRASRPDARRPAPYAPAPTQAYTAVPPIPSPVSPVAPVYPYSYDASQGPLRPQPVKPGPYAPPARRVPPPSSVGSSDEGDPSRPVSQLRHARSGYLTASASEAEDPRFRTIERERKRLDHSPSPSPPPTMNKRHSFSRTGGSYPFSNGETSDELSPSSDEDDRSTRYGPSSAGGRSSRTRVSTAPSRSEEPYRAPPGGASRTMVSAPPAATRSTGRTTVSSPPPPSSSSAMFRPSPTQLLSREGPSGFTGFDVHGAEREARDADFERDERERREWGRILATGKKSGSAMRYGTHGAPIGRRAAQRLGL